jgi:nicotinamidase-related amidase
MTAPPTIDANTSALLVMDFQTPILDGITSHGLVESTASLIAAARAASARVIYVVVGFRAGYPEVSARNPMFEGVRQSRRFEGQAFEIPASLTPLPTDIVIAKHRVSSFAGTDLDMILRANGLETLVLSGIVTSGVVLSTVRHAADADYRVIVVEDCCADRDPEVHRVLMAKVFPRQATVTNLRAAVEALRGP